MDLRQQEEIQEHFERMYRDGQKPWRYHPPSKSLAEFFRRVEENPPAGGGKAKILDIGCGDGWISLEAASKGHEVWGLDSSKTAISDANVSAEKEGLGEILHFEVEMH